MEEDLLFDIIDVLRELRFAVEPLANDSSTTPSPATTLALSSPTSRSLHSVNQLSNSLVQQSMLLEQFVRQLHELLYVVKNSENDYSNSRRGSDEKKSTLLMSSSEIKSVAMQISPAVELLLIRKFGDVLEGAHGVRLLTEIICNERPRRSSMGELSPSSNISNKGNTGSLNHASNDHNEVCEKGKLPRSLPPLSPKSASTTSLSSFTSLSCVQNKYDEQHTLETFQSLLQNIEDAMRLLRIAYPNIFASTSLRKGKVNTPLTSISDNTSNNNNTGRYEHTNSTEIESYTSSESDDGKQSVSSASLEELDASAPTPFKIANHSNDINYEDKDEDEDSNSTEERVSGKDDSESLMSTLNTHKAASPLLRSVTVPCRDASQEQIHTDSLDATINTVIERISSNERWSGENSPVVHAMNATQLPEITTAKATSTKATLKETTHSRQLQGELTMRSLSSKSLLSSSSSSSSVTTPTQELHTKQNTHIQEQEEQEHYAKSTNEQNKNERISVATKRKSNSADLMDVGTPPLHSSPSSAKLVIGTDKKRSHSQSNNDNHHNHVFYSITSRESESSPRMSVNTIPYCNRTPTQSTSLEASPLSEMTYNSNTKSYMSNSNVNSSRCVIGHDDLLNSPDIHAISFNSKTIPNSNTNSDNTNMNAKTREESALCDVDVLMENLLSLEGNVQDTRVRHARNNQLQNKEEINSTTECHHHHLEEEKELKVQKDRDEPAQTVHGDINVHHHESYVSTAVSYTTTETSHSSNSVVAPLSFASSEEYVSCSSYPTQSVTLNANSNTSVFNSMEEKTQSRLTSDVSNDDTAPFTPSKHDNAVHDNNDEDKVSGKQRKEDNEEKIINNTHQVSLMVAVGNNVNREESNHLAEESKNTNADVENEQRESQHSLTTCHEEIATSSTSESKAQEATPLVEENENQDKVDVEIEESKYVVTKHTHCISGTQWSCLLEGELHNLLVETFCLDIVDLFNYCGSNTSKRQFQLSDVRDVHFSIAGNYLYVLFALHHDIHLSETEINMRVSLCEFPALMALHDSAVVENEMSNANRKRASSMASNSVSESINNKRNSDSIKKKDEHGAFMLHHHLDNDKDQCKDLQTTATKNTAENKIGALDVHTKPKSEARSNSSTPHKRTAVQWQQKRATPVNDLLRSIRKLGTRTRSTSTPPIEEHRTSMMQTTLHGSRSKIIDKDSMSKNAESYKMSHTNEKKSEHTSAMSVHEEDIDKVNSETKRGRRKSSYSFENNNDSSGDIITNKKDKSQEMPSPIRTIPQPTSFTCNSASLVREQNNSIAITMKTKSSTKNKSKDNRLHTPCKSSTSSREASQNVSTHETRHLRHHTGSIAVPISHTVYKESAMKVKAQHGMSESNAAHEEHTHDPNSTSASTLRSTDQPRRWCPVPEPRIQNNSSTSEEREKVKNHHRHHLLRQKLQRRRSQSQEDKNNTNNKIVNTKTANTVNEILTATAATVNEFLANKQQSKVDKITKSEANIVMPEQWIIVKDPVLEEIEKDNEEQKNEVKHAKQLLESQSENEVQCNALQLPLENAKSTTSIINNKYCNNDDAALSEICTNAIAAIIPSCDVEPVLTASTLALQTKDKNKNLEESTIAKLTVDNNATSPPPNAQNLNKLEEQEEIQENQGNMINNLDQHLLLTPKQLSTSSLSSSSSSPSPLPSPAPSPQLPSAYSKQYVCDATISTNKAENNNKLVLTEAELIMSAMERVLGFIVGDHPLQITRILTENSDVNTKSCNTNSSNNHNVMRKSRRRRSISEKLADTSILSEGNSSVSNINKISNKLKGTSTVNTAQNVQHTNELQLCKGDILRTVDGQVILSKLLLFEYMATRAQHNIHSVFLTVSRARGSHAMCRLSLEPLFASQTQLTQWADKLHEIAQEQEEQPLVIKKKEREKESMKKENSRSSNISNKTTANVNVEIIDNKKDSVSSTKGSYNGGVNNTVDINNDYTINEKNNNNESNNNTTVNEINAQPIRRSSISDSIHSLVNPSEMPTSSNRLLPQLLFDNGEIEPVSVISPLSLYTDSSLSTLVQNKTNNTKINPMAYNKKEHNKIDNRHQQKQEPQNTKAVPGLKPAISTLELTSCSSLESATTTSSTAELQSNMSTKRTRLTSNPVISINQVTPFDKSTIHVPHITAKVRAPSKHIFVQR